MNVASIVYQFMVFKKPSKTNAEWPNHSCSHFFSHDEKNKTLDSGVYFLFFASLLWTCLNQLKLIVYHMFGPFVRIHSANSLSKQLSWSLWRNFVIWNNILKNASKSVCFKLFNIFQSDFDNKFVMISRRFSLIIHLVCIYKAKNNSLDK